MNKKYFCLFLFVISPVFCFGDYLIKGRLQLVGNKYYPRIYLSAVPSVNNLYTASPLMVINSADIQADGSFVMSGSDLPSQAQFYRLYLTDAANKMALIDAGPLPNFLVLALGPSSSVTLFADSLRSMKDVTVLDDPLTVQVAGFYNFLFDLRQKTTDKPYVSVTQTRLADDFFKSQLLNYTDTCRDAMVSLLAFLHIPQREKLYTSDRNSVEKVIDKLSSQYANSIYLKEIKDELAGEKFKNNEFVLNSKTAYVIGGTFIILAVGFAVGVIVVRKRAFSTTTSPVGAQPMLNEESMFARYRSLTPKEREIVNLLAAGNSNKEVSVQLFIEQSTVKTHINSIYNKLGVNSRGEFLDIVPLLPKKGVDPISTGA